MSEKLPDISHLRGLGRPMFFSFDVEKKTNILIGHAAIMGTFILHSKDKLNLCQMSDDPRLFHFLKYIFRNGIGDFGEDVEKLKTEIEQHHAKVREIDKLIQQAKNKTMKL